MDLILDKKTGLALLHWVPKTKARALWRRLLEIISKILQWKLDLKLRFEYWLDRLLYPENYEEEICD